VAVPSTKTIPEAPGSGLVVLGRRALWATLTLMTLSSWNLACGDDAGDSGDAPADVQQDATSSDAPPGDAPAGDALDDADVSAPPVSQPLYVYSAPSEYAFVGAEYRYRPRVSGAGTPALELIEAPPGMTLGADGRLRWTPGLEDVGAARVTLRATLGGDLATQTYRIEVRAVTTFARDTVGSAGGSVVAYVAPEGLDGAALVLPPGAVKEDTTLELGVLSEPLVVPGLWPDAPTRQLVLGPPGTAFHRPFVLHLPYPPELAADVSELQVFVLDEASGAWGTAPIIGHDPLRHTLFVESTHFSIYTVAQSVLSTALTLYDLDGLDGCHKSYASQAFLEQPLSAVPATSVRQLDPDIYEAAVASGEALDVAALVQHPDFHGSLQVRKIHSFAFRHQDEDVLSFVMKHQSVHVTLFAPGDGTASLAIARGEQQATPAWIRRDINLHADWPEIDAILRGASNYARISTSLWCCTYLSGPLREFTVFKDLVVKPIFVHLPGDATERPHEGASHAFENYLPASAYTKGPASVPAASPDTDCDWIDDEVQDELGAGLSLSGAPGQLVQAAAGEAVSLECAVHGGASGDALEWSVDAASTSLTILSSGPSSSTAEVVAAEPGLHLVTCALPDAMGGASYQFAIEAHAPDPTIEPPPCVLATTAESVPAGGALGLAGAAGPSELDVDQLVTRWGLVVSGALEPSEHISPTDGAEATFAPDQPGSYTVGCQIFWGAAGGPIGEATIEVLDEGANQPPSNFYVSPPAAIVAPGEPLTLTAYAYDPDGDALTFTWEPAELVAELADDTHEGDDNQRSSAVFVADTPGFYQLTVSVSDGNHPAQVRSAGVSVLIGQEGPLAWVDPDEVIFPTTEVGAEVKAHVWLRNVGTVPITWASSVAGEGFEAGSFSGTLHPNGAIGPEVRFVPPAAGSFAGTFTYTFEGGTIDVPLHGVAVDEVCDGAGQCEICTPSCAGRDCGDDGCGGSCGTCPAGSVCGGLVCVADPCPGVTCPIEAACLNAADLARIDDPHKPSPAAIATSCGAQVCVAQIGTPDPFEACVDSCMRDGASPIEAVELTDGCRGCYAALVRCTAEHCVNQDGAASGDGQSCQATHCLPQFFVCSGLESPSSCVPMCADDPDACGDDGCGGSCGTCPAGSVCGGLFCVADPCLGVTCPPGQSCEDGVCLGGGCEPSCGLATCGDDGCGGSCGTCPAGSVCDGLACVADPCLGVTCPPGQSCADGVCLGEGCEPSCGLATCGDDGCGGSCGHCEANEYCVLGHCSATLPGCPAGHCTVPPPVCDGHTRVELTLAGCIGAECIFHEHTQDCASDGDVCEEGACVTPCEPACPSDWRCVEGACAAPCTAGCDPFDVCDDGWCLPVSGCSPAECAPEPPACVTESTVATYQVVGCDDSGCVHESTTTGCALDETCHAGGCRRPAACEPACEETEACVGGGCTSPGAARIQASNTHTCHVDSDGVTWCWGSNSGGQLGAGLGTYGVTSVLPVRVVVETGDGGLAVKTDWVKMNTGIGGRTCGIDADSRAWCWGSHGNTHAVAVPAEDGGDPWTDWIGITAGGGQVCGWRHDSGSVSAWCWGDSSSGKTGLGSFELRTTPGPVVGAGGGSAFDDWVELSAGTDHTCGVRADGSLWCWGRNQWDQLGVTGLTEMCGAAACTTVPLPVQGEGWVQVAAGARHTCARKQDGSLWCWGRNNVGQLGLGMNPLDFGSGVVVPTRVGVNDDWTHVAVHEFNTCALRDDASLWCWGRNNAGNLGIGSTSSWSTIPVPVLSVDAGEPWTDWVGVTVGQHHTCGLRPGLFPVWCWGDASYGKLGNEDAESPTTSPIPVPSLAAHD